jgi:hypothetical protein
MAYYTKYRAEFKNIFDKDWRVDIQEVAAEQGTITDLDCTGTPLFFEWYGADDIYTQRIIGSKMSLNVWSSTDFVLFELFASDNLKFKVIAYYKEVAYWSGFILPYNYQEPYDQSPLNTTIVATDGLGLLKDFKFVDLGYTTRQKISVVIHDMLDLVGITIFTEYVNLYNADMDDTVDDSPLDQTGIDPDLFFTSNCYEALEAMLKLFNAGIRQDNNIITIYRFNEVVAATMYGRIFTTGTDRSSTSRSTAQYLNRDGQPSDLWDVEGGVLGGIVQAKTLILNYNLGLKPSVLKNWDFIFGDFILTEGIYTIPNWTASNVVISPISSQIGGEGNGIYLFANAFDITNKNIEQTILDVKTRAPQFKIAYEARLHNADINAVPVVVSLRYSLMLTGASVKYWVDDGSIGEGIGSVWAASESEPTYTYKAITNPPSGWGDWQTIECLIDGVPIDGDLTLYLFAASAVSELVNVDYRNVKLIMTPIEGSDETGIGYTVSCATTGRIIEEEVKLGDGFTVARYTVNQLLNYNGIINGYSGVDIIAPSTVWHTRGNTENKAINELIGEEIGAQYETARQLIDLPLIEQDSNTFLTSIGNLQDTLNPGAIFHPSISSFNVRDREYQLVLTQIL